MPTIIHFVGAEQPLRLEEDYDKVTAQFIGDEAGHFGGGDRNRVTVYRSNVAYIEEISGEIFAEHV
jgi:hypothetical protein